MLICFCFDTFEGKEKSFELLIQDYLLKIKLKLFGYESLQNEHRITPDSHIKYFNMCN
jgi:hypothetical protein